MSQVLGIKFRDHGPIYYFDSGAFVVKSGDSVLVQTEQGLGLGSVALCRQDPPEGMTPEELKPVYRLANQEDLDTHRENQAYGREAFRYCRDCISERQLEMKLVDVEVYHDRGKIIFYFTAPGRIDFRELVKDLVREYRTRIELRQIGVRHESQMLGAIGNCGQMCCCARFLRKFAPVTIKMAKEQNLFLNPTKISGICGRLLCCLNYEQGSYEEFQRRCPKMGKKFNTTQGLVKTLRSNLFRETVTVLSEEGEEKELELSRWREILLSSHESLDRPDGAPQAASEVKTPQAALQPDEPAQSPSAPRQADSEERGESQAARQKRKRKRKPRPRREGGPESPQQSGPAAEE